MKKFIVMLVVVIGCVLGTKAMAWEYYYYPCYTAPVVVQQPYYYYNRPVVYQTPWYGGYYNTPYYRPIYCNYYYRPYYYYWGW